MKLLLGSISFFLFLTEFCFGQWLVQNPLPERGSLSNVFFLNANYGMVVGINGTILKTTNGGNDWISLPSNTPDDLYAVTLTDTNNGIAVGDKGMILRTIDGGENWNEVQSGTTNKLRDVCFSNGQNGWIVAGQWYENNVILKTTNGGATWDTQNCASTQPLYGVSFTDANNGVAVGDSGTIVKTTNGGEDWIEVESGTTCHLRDICFTDEQNGWVVGLHYDDPNYNGHIILVTTNGGDTWDIQPDTIDQNYNFYAVSFSDPYNGIIIGSDHWDWGMTYLYIILNTNDGGLTWTVQKSGINEQFTSTCFSDSVNGTAVSNIGTILRTTDRGESWNIQGGTTNGLGDICFTDPNNGYVVGTDGIFSTSDGGKNWEELFYSSDYHFIRKISFVDRNSGWVIDGELFGGYTILHTTNGGIEWLLQYEGRESILDIFSIYENNCIAVEGNDIIKTTNGGKSWVEHFTGATHYLTAIFFVDDSIGTVVGYGGAIFKTTDGGENWTEQSSGTTRCLNAVFFTDVNTGIAVGEYNKIIKTTDGGENWVNKSDFAYTDFNDITFTDPNNGIIVGYPGKILKTTDGGDTWTEQSIGKREYRHLNGVFFTDRNNGWICGSGGVILHTTNGGVTFVEENKLDEIPAEFLLSQNFPNPFNPTTKIKYSIQNRSIVTLKVYDILANEIETLVNEEKSAGTYDIIWNAANLPSGVYIYRLQAVPAGRQTGSFTESRKMILLK